MAEAERVTLKTELDGLVAQLVASAAPDWPVSANHCFLRIAYDNAVEARWDTVVARPAWRHLPLDTLAAAVVILDRIRTEGRPTLVRLNAASLGHRRRARRSLERVA